ncbi:ABC transporter ATP-binding protein/permease [Candidatus Saccharibacteria bacterium]|nr:ABC transporter ATP-binding protein/permease [Candidatus Saccharibacteria bacterium]
MLELRGVTKVYETGGLRHKALDKVSLNFRENEFVAILGPSGSGKTTLLNIIGGLDHYTSGDLKINEVSTKDFNDKDWDAYRNHRIGFVFQSYNLIPHQTVLSNVVLALTLSGISKREAVRRAKKALSDVGLSEHINKKPSQLSGGQMQRVAIARALVNNPDILLADEPTGALDSETSVQIMNLLQEIAREKLVIMVTHNPELAKQYATRIITLKDGTITSDSDSYDGKIKTRLDHENARSKTHKTKMSFLTALSLSLKNLLTKKGRTTLVAFAGSIGIIGIALILAVSTGFQAYIDSIENDTLTSYPLAIRREAADVTSVLLNNALNSGGGGEDGKVHENQVLASALGNVTNNDLKDFQEYIDAHYDEISADLRVVEHEYSVEPLIYTIDATGDLAQLNPNNLFSSVMGGSQLISSYTSVYQQYERANMEQDFKILAGELPDAYNEVVVVLSEEGKIGDLLTYSLGLHDTDELNTIVTKLLSGETVNINNEPLTLTYEDIMNIKLKLLFATDLYKYNADYNVYEDMSSDEAYMRELYAAAEELKIVGVVTPRDNLMSLSGVAYLPELVTHIIDKAGQAEIVKRQIANPSVDVFSDTKFGEKGNNLNLTFEDLVKVDSGKLGAAIKVNIDQNAVSQKTAEYMAEISGEITTDIAPAEAAYFTKLSELAAGVEDYIQEKVVAGEVTLPELMTDTEKRQAVVSEYLSTQDFDGLAESYLIPADNLRTTYLALLDGYVLANAGGMSYEDFAETAPVVGSMKMLAEASTKFVMQKEILTKVGELTNYLTETFATGFGIDPNALLGAFTLNFSQDELTRIVTAMFTETESTYATNLIKLGYQDLAEPTQLSFYFTSFDGKTDFMSFIDRYNDLMREFGQNDRVIEYTDTTGLLMNSVKVIVDAVSYVLIAFVSISLVVSSIMIGIITYISVYERTKEIGILRAIGASKHNISSIFNAETFIVGLLSGVFGIVISYLLIPVINVVLHAFIGDVELYAQLAPVSAMILIVISVMLTLLGGLIPARAAAKKDPVEALRSE